MNTIIKELNDLKIVQKSLDYLEDLPEEIYKKYFENKGCVYSGDVDKHRWYETSVEVYKVDGVLIGVCAVTDCFSEQSEVQDMFHTLRFFEMEEYTTISYKKKKDE